MRKKYKLLSLIITVCIAAPALTGITFTNADSVDDFTLPDIVDSEEARENRYVGRVTEDETDLYTFVFQNGSGSKTMRVYSHPVKYVASNGEIRDISLEVQKKADGSFITADHEIITAFERNLTDGISLTYNDIEVTLVPDVNPSTSSAATLGNENKLVTYILDDTTSYEYSLTYAGFKEDIVVNHYTGQTEYAFTLYTNGLTLCEEYGSYYLADSEGSKEATIGDIIVFTADERNNTLGSMTYETVRENQEYILTIHLDDAYLSDEATVYPIRIDPTIEINYDKDGAGAIEDVTIRENHTYAGDSGSLNVGRCSDGTRARALMRFPNLQMPVTLAPMILSAQVELRDIMCQDKQDFTVYCHEYYEYADSWSEASSTTWSGMPSNYVQECLDSKLISYGKGNVEAQRHRYAFDITALAKRWAVGTRTPGHGIVFKADDAFESQTQNNWCKTFASYNRSSNKPSLSIRYETMTMFLISNGSRYLQAPSSGNAIAVSSSKDSSNPLQLWCVEYLGNDRYTINAIGKGDKGSSYSYAIYNTTSSAGLTLNNGVNSVQYTVTANSETAFYLRNVSSGYFLSLPLGATTPTGAQSRNLRCLFTFERIPTDTFNNFYSGSYSKGIYNGVAHIKIELHSSIKESSLFKDNDFSAALLWNGITDKVIIYGPEDKAPTNIDPFVVTFKALDMNRDRYAITVPNNYTCEEFVNIYSNTDEMNEILFSDWNAVTIYLNSNSDHFPSSAKTDYNRDTEGLINTVICHEMGHALKLNHPGAPNIHTWSEARTSNPVTVFSVIDYIPVRRLAAAAPQYYDKINLISKWEYHINCSHAE